MKVTGVCSDGFRNLEGRIPICQPLGILVGENNAGKSNAIDALRILFWPEGGPKGRQWISPEDFAHDGRGQRVADEFVLEAELDGLSDEEMARMVTCLAPSRGRRAARLRLRARIDESGKIAVEWFGGDSEHPDVERWAREAVTFTYLHPLRDAAADLRPGRDNRLVDLLGALAPGQTHPDRVEIERVLEVANKALEEVGAMASAQDSIQERLEAIAGGGEFAQRSDLVFADPQFDRIVAALRAMAGAHAAAGAGKNGLAYNNLLYMAVLIAALSRPDEAALRVLLVEEPEAHLHPQLQDLLMRYLETESGGHPSDCHQSLAEPRVGRPGRADDGGCALASPSLPARQGLWVGDKQIDHLRRFLDVTKAALLFARRVVLVEGIAEQLLIPVIAERLGVPLPTDGVTVINVGGVAFGPSSSCSVTEPALSRSDDLRRRSAGPERRGARGR